MEELFVAKFPFRDFKLIENDVSKLRKDQISQFLGLPQKESNKAKKNELVSQILEKIKDNEFLQRKLYRDFAFEFSMYPSQVEEMLNITKTERNRWKNEGKLKTVGKGAFKKGSNYIEYDVFEVIQISSITQEQIKKWREEHKQKVFESRKKAAKKSVTTRKINKSLQKKFYEEEWKPMLLKWRSTNGYLAATLQLAYWTVWVSRWAKEFHIKAMNAKTKKEEYQEKQESFYEMKNKAIHLLHNSIYSKLTFYQPDNPDKVECIHLCKKHYEWWCIERKDYYYPVRHYYFDNEKQIKKCKECQVTIFKDYYSLYYLEIGDERLPEFSFSFHTPYPIGLEFLPDKEALPIAKEHYEQEGIFRFGRSLFEEEKVVFSQKEVLKQFKEATITFKLYLSED